MNDKLNSPYQENRSQKGTSGLNLGKVYRPIIEYIDQINNKDLKVLIPGAGNSYEADHLFRKGFKNVYVEDPESSPLKKLKVRILEFADKLLFYTNFFKIEIKFDLIIEQKIFCAIAPIKRSVCNKIIGVIE